MVVTLVMKQAKLVVVIAISKRKMKVNQDRRQGQEKLNVNQFERLQLLERVSYAARDVLATLNVPLSPVFNAARAPVSRNAHLDALDALAGTIAALDAATVSSIRKTIQEERS